MGEESSEGPCKEDDTPSLDYQQPGGYAQLSGLCRMLSFYNTLRVLSCEFNHELALYPVKYLSITYPDTPPVVSR